MKPRFLASLALIASVLVPLVPLHAQSTLVLTESFKLKGGDLTTNVSFAPFNSSLGSLQGVTLDYNGTQRFDFAFWNNRAPVGTSSNITYHFSPNTTIPGFGGSVLNINGIAYGIPDSSDYTGAVTLASVSAADIALAKTAARDAFYAGGDPSSLVTASGGYSVYGTLPVTGSLTLANTFDGLLSVQFNPVTSASLTGGNTSSAQMQELDFDGTFKLTYTYAAIPEPATYAALLGAVVLGFAVIKRRRVA